MNESKAVVRTNHGITEKFEINTGVRQGDALSAMLFNILLESIIRKIKDHGKLNINMTQIIAYADDIAIVSRTKEELEKTFKELDRAAKKTGLYINQEKTKYMKSEKQKSKTISQHKVKIKINNYNIEEVDKFSYLGTQISSTDNSQEIKARIQAGYRAYAANKKLLKNKSISKHTKLKIYNTLIKPIVTYALESLRKQDEEQIRIFERKILRTIMGPKKENENEYRPLMNYEIQKQNGGQDIVKNIKAQRIRWIGHVIRKNKHATIRTMMEWEPIENRRRGRPRARWMDQVKQELRTLEVNNWREKAQNRKTWREIVDIAKYHKHYNVKV